MHHWQIMNDQEHIENASRKPLRQPGRRGRRQPRSAPAAVGASRGRRQPRSAPAAGAAVCASGWSLSHSLALVDVHEGADLWRVKRDVFVSDHDLQLLTQQQHSLHGQPHGMQPTIQESSHLRIIIFVAFYLFAYNNYIYYFNYYPATKNVKTAL